MKNDRGFTLVEVVAALVLITIVLLSFVQIFVQTNKSAVHNNDQLITINLAEAELERLKIAPFDEYLPKPDVISGSLYSQQNKSFEKELYTDGPKYTITINATQNNKEKFNKLINIVLKVELGKISSTVEGYIKYE